MVQSNLRLRVLYPVVKPYLRLAWRDKGADLAHSLNRPDTVADPVPIKLTWHCPATHLHTAIEKVTLAILDLTRSYLSGCF